MPSKRTVIALAVALKLSLDETDDLLERAGYAPSTLVKSLLSDSEMSSLNFSSSNMKNWIKTNCRRIDIIINAGLGVFAFELIERIMHYKYEPRYEGFASQMYFVASEATVRFK